MCIRRKYYEKKPYGFLFFPAEAGSAKQVRLQIRETDTGTVHVLKMGF